MTRCTMFGGGLMAVLLFLGGCGNDTPATHDQALQAMIGHVQELNTILKSVTDENSAKAAVPKLQTLNRKAQKTSEAMKAMGEPSADQERQLEQKYKSQMEKAMGEMMGEMFRIAMNPTLAQHLEPEMERFGEAMDQ